MALKDGYTRSISLRCITCGVTYAFEENEKTGYVTCHKCNRIYQGGKEELIRLNEAQIEDEKEQLFDEVKMDVEVELLKMFDTIKFK